eukprot:2616970-Prymnesium_polylepis.1
MFRVSSLKPQLSSAAFSPTRALSSPRPEGGRRLSRSACFQSSNSPALHADRHGSRRCGAAFFGCALEPVRKTVHSAGCSVTSPTVKGSVTCAP